MFSFSGKLDCYSKGCQHNCVIEYNEPVCKCHSGFNQLDDGSCRGEWYIVLLSCTLDIFYTLSGHPNEVYTVYS